MWKPLSIDVSIIVCTRDRADDLTMMLRSLAGTQIPSGLACELLVVDNGSTDNTQDVIRGFAFYDHPVHYVHHSAPGLDNARNAGVRASRGSVILFADDDVRVPADWIGPMVMPIFNGTADAVGGGIRTAEHLRAPLGGLVEIVSEPGPNSPVPLIGANCAFARRVFGRIPCFDPDLDAGQIGLGGDTLFAAQVHQAGFRVLSRITQVAVEHHFHESRNTRDELLRSAAKLGRSDAYVWHHWSHREVRFLRLRLAVQRIRLGLLRGRLGARGRPAVGLDPREGKCVVSVEFLLGSLVVRGQMRRYGYKGLRRLDLAADCCPC